MVLLFTHPASCCSLACNDKYDETRLMIQCDRCDGWFHLDCCNVDEDTVELIDLFVCPECSNEEFHTTFRQKCLRNGCPKPREHLSKYCSDYCGTEVAALRLLESGIEPMRLWEVVKGARGTNSSVKREDQVMKEMGNEASRERQEETEEEADIQRLAALRGRMTELQAKRSGIQKHVELVNARLQFLQVAIKRWDSLLRTTLEAIKAAGGVLPDIEEEIELVGKKGKKSKKSGKTKKAQGHAKDEAPCGFDVRLVWSDKEFEAWIESEEGKQALAWREGITEEGREGGEGYTCLLPKKKCTRHDGWKEIREADFEVERSILMRNLERLSNQERLARSRLDEFQEHLDFIRNIRKLKQKRQGPEERDCTAVILP
ncbi:hypothetical protein BT69DRAFT_26991 [Atractiella rhizophila]|nr:hypothetical protein BT69DRAFT_26991 [Atractiella rhizophila]